MTTNIKKLNEYLEQVSTDNLHNIFDNLFDSLNKNKLTSEEKASHYKVIETISRILHERAGK